MSTENPLEFHLKLVKICGVISIALLLLVTTSQQNKTTENFAFIDPDKLIECDGDELWIIVNGLTTQGILNAEMDGQISGDILELHEGQVVQGCLDVDSNTLQWRSGIYPPTGSNPSQPSSGIVFRDPQTNLAVVLKQGDQHQEGTSVHTCSGTTGCVQKFGIDALKVINNNQ